MEDMLVTKKGCREYSEALGIGEERAKSLTLNMADELLEADSVSEGLERIWNNCNNTFEEKVFLTFKAGHFLNDPQVIVGAMLHKRMREGK